MKVGFLIDRWDPERGGAERALALLARRLEQRGARVLAFANEGRPGAPGQLVRVPRRGLGRGARARALARDLPRAARAAGCDVTVGVRHLSEVDLYWPHGGVHAVSLAARREALGEDPEGKPQGRHRTFIALERALLEQRRVRSIVCVSELVRAELAQHYPGCRDLLRVVANGVSSEAAEPTRHRDDGGRLRASLGLGTGTPLLAFVARDPLLKGIEPLADALRGLQDRPWHLLVAGPKHAAPWRRLFVRAGVGGPRVTVREQVPRGPLFAAADLTVHPTFRDPAPLVVLESLAAGTPVVTTRRAGNAELVTPAAGAVIEHPRDVQALRGAVRHWLERVRGGRVEAALVRAAVAGRTEERWLDELEAEVSSLRERPLVGEA